MNEIRALYYKEFTEKVYNDLNTEFKGEYNLEDKEFSCEMIEDLINEAEEYSFKSEVEIYTYVKMFYQYTTLQERPLDDAVVEILTWPDRPAATKFELLIELFDNG